MCILDPGKSQESLFCSVFLQRDSNINFLYSGTVWLDDASLTEVDEVTGIREPVVRGVVPDTLFGIHINKLGTHNVWPAMGQKTMRLWDTGTRWGDMELANNSWAGAPRLDYYLTYAHAGYKNLIDRL